MTAVSVVPYSDTWPATFGVVRDMLARVFPGDGFAIEHIGSTSVPGLVAKPVIDVLLGAPSLTAIEAGIDALAALGFEYVPKYEREIPLRRYFVHAAVNGLRVHVHGVEKGARIWQEHLAFRTALRTDDALRERYQALKLALAEQHAHDKAAYTEAKEPFIRAVLTAMLRT